MCLKVSVVIPVLNESATIAKAIDRAWRTRPHEVIVVDGGSEDDTYAIAADSDCLALRSARGRGVQQNYGASQASGNVLLFLHADNWLAAEGMQQLAAALKDPAVQAGAFRQRIDAAGWLYRWLERGNAWRARRWARPLGDQGIFVRRGLFERIGGFPETALMEDVLLVRRIRQYSRPILLPGPIHISARRWQRHGVIRQTARNWLLLAAFGLGVNPDQLAEFYPPHK